MSFRIGFDTCPWLRRALAVLVATWGAGLAPALYAQFAPERAYHQSEAVKRQYPDPAVKFDTPGFVPGRADFTNDAETSSFLSSLQRQTANMQVRIVGASQEGRAIPLLIFSNAGTLTTADLLRLNRPVVLLVGLQHGNEPAGGEAMLALAKELATGSLKPLLDRITVLIMPRANPDGAHYFTRSPYANTDMNRDHVKVELPETAALHRVVNEYRPQVFVDAHEFSVATRWLEKFGLLQSWDLMLQHATNPNVAPQLTELAEHLFLPAMRGEIERAGYTHFWYYTTSYNTQDKNVAMGGTVPDIGRNFAALQGAVSFLVESRGVGIGRESYARRVHSHLVAIGSVLRSTADHADRVMAATRSAQEELIRRGREPRGGDTVAVTVTSPRTRQTLTMIDPQSGERKDIEVDWSDSLGVRAELSRARPYAYLMPPVFHDVARRLAASGVEVRRLRSPATLEVESYEVTERRTGAAYVEGRVVSRVATEVTAKKKTFPAGSYVYLMAQPNAQILAVALEPESPSSFVSFGYVPVDRKGAPATIAAPSEVPVYRLLVPAALDAEPVSRR